MDTPTLPTTIHVATIDNEKSLTNQGYSVLKLRAIAELEEMTIKGKQDIDNAVTIATNTAIGDLKSDYDTILTDWDKTKAELDIETQIAITSIQHTIDESSQVSENVSQISKDLEETKHDVKLLDQDIDKVVAKAKSAVAQATKEATDTAVIACSDDLYEKNATYIANMDDVFSENMGLMQELQSSYDLQDAISKATAASLQ